MGRTGTQDAQFWDEVLRKEERWNSKCVVGRRAKPQSVSEGMQAAFGIGWQDQTCGDPGEMAAIQEILREATANRAVNDAREKRLAREAKAHNPRKSKDGVRGQTPRGTDTSRSASQWASFTRGSSATWTGPAVSCVSSTLGGIGFDANDTYVSGEALTLRARRSRGEVLPNAVRTDAAYMKTSPTYQHSDEIDWFGPGNQNEHPSHGAKGYCATTVSDASSMPAAGASLDALRSDREASRSANMRSTVAGRRRLEQLSGRAAMIAQRGGHR